MLPPQARCKLGTGDKEIEASIADVIGLLRVFLYQLLQLIDLLQRCLRAQIIRLQVA